MSKGGIEIRFAIESDLDTIQTLNKGLYEYENEHGFYEDSYDLKWTCSEAGTKYFAGLLASENANSAAFLALKENHAVGYLAASLSSPTYRSQKPIAEIDNMFVVEEHRDTGTGTALVKAFMNWARVAGAKRAKVGAFSGNTAAAFYRNCGFHDHEIVLEAKL